MITSLIMRDQTYSIIMNVILQANAERVNAISKNMQKYKFKVSLERLGVSKYFQFNQAFREQIMKGASGEEIIAEEQRVNFETIIEKNKGSLPGNSPTDIKAPIPSGSIKPFERTINALKEIPEINSPMSKLEYIY